jgi:hypothetical protein
VVVVFTRFFSLITAVFTKPLFVRVYRVRKEVLSGQTLRKGTVAAIGLVVGCHRIEGEKNKRDDQDCPQ